MFPGERSETFHGDETSRRRFTKPALSPLRFIPDQVRAHSRHLCFPSHRSLFPSRRFPFLFHRAAHESIWPSGHVRLLAFGARESNLQVPCSPPLRAPAMLLGLQMDAASAVAAQSSGCVAPAVEEKGAGAASAIARRHPGMCRRRCMRINLAE